MTTSQTPLIYKTFYDFEGLVLWADSPDAEEGKRASLKLSFRDGKPRFVVSTGMASGRDGMINFPMDIPHFVAVMNLLKDVANGPKGNIIHVDSSGSVYENNKPTSQLEVKATLHFGKTVQGVTYISITAENKPKIIFPFQPSRYHEFRNTDKSKLDPELVSKSMTCGLVDMLLSSVAQLMVNYTNEAYETGTRKPMLIVPPGSAGSTGSTVFKPKTKSDDFSDLDEIAL